MKRNQLFKALEYRGLALGAFVQMNSPEICELMSAAGLDYVFIDMEHGSIGIAEAANLIRGVQAGGAAAPIVRLPDASTNGIGPILDAGAQGIVVPGIDTAEQMQAVVRAAHFGPFGARGACPAVRANNHGVTPWGEYSAWARDNIWICGCVESEEGIRNYDEIIAVEGVNAIGIGTFDLSVAMGLAGDYQHPAVVAKMKELSAAARAKGLDIFGAVVDYSNMSAELERLKSADARVVMYPGDRFLLSSIYRNAVASLSSWMAPA